MSYENTGANDNQTISIQESTELLKPQESFYSNWTNIIPMIPIVIIMYFLLIRPQEKRRRQQATLISSVKKGEEILTSGGIFGVVTKISDHDHVVEIEIAKDTQIKILKNVIVDIVSRKSLDKLPAKPEKLKKDRTSATTL